MKSLNLILHVFQIRKFVMAILHWKKGLLCDQKISTVPHIDSLNIFELEFSSYTNSSNSGYVDRGLDCMFHCTVIFTYAVCRCSSNLYFIVDLWIGQCFSIFFFFFSLCACVRACVPVCVCV